MAYFISLCVCNEEDDPYQPTGTLGYNTEEQIGETLRDAIHNYSESRGIGMKCTSFYYEMTIYKNGVVEYVSSGAYSSTTYLQFQEASQSWELADSIAVSDTWDACTPNMRRATGSPVSTRFLMPRC